MADEIANDEYEAHIDPMAEDLGVDEDSHVAFLDDEGVEVEFEYVGSVDYKDEEYIVLLPVEDDENGEAEVMILKVESVEGEDGEEEEQYVSVESEDVLNEVFAIFKQENADDFDFVE